MMSLVYFVRHGQTSWNSEHRLQGQVDTPMTELGKSQADGNGRKLAEMITDPAAFSYVASPLSRTRETMERVRIAMGLPAEGYAVDSRLMEVNFGDWQGLTYAQVEEKYPGAVEARHADKWNFLPPGKTAESYQMLLERVQPALAELRGPTVCVTHGGVVRVLFRLVENVSEEEASTMEIPQDRVLRLQDGKLAWV